MPKWGIARGAKKINCLDLKRYARSVLLRIQTGLKEIENKAEKNTTNT